MLGLSYTPVNRPATEANLWLRTERPLEPPRSPRAARLAELESDPPEWLKSIIGRLSSRRTQEQILAWRQRDGAG